MSPVRDKGVGTYVIDRNFSSIGRIKRASGTTDKRLFKKLNGMLTSLYDAGRLDILRQIRDGHLHLFEVWEHHRVGQWDQIPSAQHLKPLRESLFEWVRSYSCSDSHRASMHRSFCSIADQGNATSTVADIPMLLAKYRLVCQRSEHYRTFDLSRRAVQAYLRSTVGRHDRLWLKTSTVESFPAKRKFETHPKTIEQARQIAELLGPKAGPMWTAMFTTGMNPKEYFEDGFEVEEGRILIKGQKRPGRYRFVPMVETPVTPILKRAGFRQALRRLKIDVTPVDARRSYANLLETARIPRTRRRMYMGHGNRDVTDLYERHEVTEFLSKDARRIRKALRRAVQTAHHTNKTLKESAE